MGKRYLVTGAGGHLGNRLVQMVCENNIDDVTHLKLLDLKFSDDVINNQRKFCSDAGIEVEWINCDVSDPKALTAAVQGSDAVFHVASIIDFKELIPYQKLRKVNVEGTLNVLQACCANNVRYCVYTSSIEAFGPNRDLEPLEGGTEDTVYPYSAVTAYGQTKKEAEDAVIGWNGKRMENGQKLVTCALRSSGIYGENDNLISSIFLRHLPTKVIKSPIPAEALQTRMYVGNVAWCHVIAAKKMQEDPSTIGGNAYFLCDETPELSYLRLNLKFYEHVGFTMHNREPVMPFWLLVTIATLVFWLCRILGWFGIKKEPNITPTMVKLSCTKFTVSNRKFIQHFGYKPKYSWPETLNRMKLYVSDILQKHENNNLKKGI